MPIPSGGGLRRRILLSCYEVPGFGGASTAAYELFRRLQQDGHDVAFVNLIDFRDRDFFGYTFGERLGNPDGLSGVHNVRLVGAPSKPQPELAALVEGVAPEVMLGVGYIATLALAHAAPGRPLVFLTVGCSEAEIRVPRQAPDVVQLQQMLSRRNGSSRINATDELEAVRAATLVMTHAPMVRDLFVRFYPDYAGKIGPPVIWFAEWIHEAARRHASLARPFADRRIDVLFIASSWDRPVKRYSYVRRIASALPEAAVHIVGDVVDRVPGAVHHGFVADREELFRLMGDARTTVSVSTIDAAPGILFEASALGSNVVASRNCGNWSLCHPDLLVDPSTVDEFVTRIRLALTRRFDDNIGEFLASGSYAELVDTLQVI